MCQLGALLQFHAVFVLPADIVHDENVVLHLPVGAEDGRAFATDPLHLRGAPGVVESRPAYDGEVVVEVYLYLPLPLERLLYGVGDDGIVHDGRGADDRPLVHYSESLARALVHPHQDAFFRIDFYADGEVAKNGVCPQLLQVQYFLGFPQGAGRTPAASGQQHQEDGQDEDGAKHGGKEEGG